MTTEKASGLALLRVPFEPHQVSKLPKPFRADSPKGNCPECGGYHGLPAMHLDYVGHAALTDRLLDADPAWSWEPLALDQAGQPVIDNNGGMWIKLTVCGVTRLGYGDAQGKTGGNAMKERIGDALRNAAMRFGAALDLWHKGDLHADEHEDGGAPAKTQKPAPRGPVIPVAKGAMEALDEKRRSFLRDTAEYVKDRFAADDIMAAHDAVYDVTDDGELMALSTLIPSHIRTAIRKHHESLKQAA